MKKSKPARQPSAVHRALVRNDLPFKGRAEELRTRYRRHAKHRNADFG